MIIALDSSTLDVNGGLEAAQSYLDAAWPTLQQGLALSVLTYASSVAVTEASTSDVRAPTLKRIGDSRAVGSMLRHLLAIYRSESHLRPRDLAIVLAGAPTDSYARELRELTTLKNCGLDLVGLVSVTAIGSEAAVHARTLRSALQTSTLHYEDSWSGAAMRFEPNTC